MYYIYVHKYIIIINIIHKYDVLSKKIIFITDELRFSICFHFYLKISALFTIIRYLPLITIHIYLRRTIYFKIIIHPVFKNYFSLSQQTFNNTLFYPFLEVEFHLQFFYFICHLKSKLLFVLAEDYYN